MRRIRVIPVLLLLDSGLVKTIRFKKPQYVGDPINAVKIFNDKEVDELVVLDIDASHKKKRPDFDLIEEMVSEAFMPVAYGGGIRSIEDADLLFRLGVEKLVFNTAAFEMPDLIKKITKKYGGQSVCVSLNIDKKALGGYQSYFLSKSKKIKENPKWIAKQMESLGVGELMVNTIHKDGTYEGYDLEILKEICESVDLPVIACGGAGKMEDFVQAINYSGASAVAAGSMFVFQRPHKAVLISYPSQEELIKNFYNKISDNEFSQGH